MNYFSKFLKRTGWIFQLSLVSFLSLSSPSFGMEYDDNYTRTQRWLEIQGVRGNQEVRVTATKKTPQNTLLPDFHEGWIQGNCSPQNLRLPSKNKMITNRKRTYDEAFFLPQETTATHGISPPKITYCTEHKNTALDKSCSEMTRLNELHREYDLYVDQQRHKIKYLSYNIYRYKNAIKIYKNAIDFHENKINHLNVEHLEYISQVDNLYQTKIHDLEKCYQEEIYNLEEYYQREINDLKRDNNKLKKKNKRLMHCNTFLLQPSSQENRTSGETPERLKHHKYPK